MYTVWHVDKYKITFKLFINWTNGVLLHIVVSSGLSRPGIIDARARRLNNTALQCDLSVGFMGTELIMGNRNGQCM
jgi:hypothetical protein